MCHTISECSIQSVSVPCNHWMRHTISECSIQWEPYNQWMCHAISECLTISEFVSLKSITLCHPITKFIPCYHPVSEWAIKLLTMRHTTPNLLCKSVCHTPHTMFHTTPSLFCESVCVTQPPTMFHTILSLFCETVCHTPHTMFHTTPVCSVNQCVTHPIPCSIQPRSVLFINVPHNHLPCSIQPQSVLWVSVPHTPCHVPPKRTSLLCESVCITPLTMFHTTPVCSVS